jgi:flagellar motor switch/type III secretory pathway protein FliN
MDAARARPWVPRLPRFSAVEARAATRFAAMLDPDADPRAAEALGALVGPPTPVWRVEPTYVFPNRELVARTAHTPFVALRLVRGGGGVFVVLVEGSLAALFAARLWARPAELGAPRPASPAERGLVVALAALWLQARGAGDLVVDGASDEPKVVQGWLGGAEVVGCDVRVDLGAGRGTIRVLQAASASASPAPRTPAAIVARLGRLATTQVTLPIELGRFRVGAAMWADLGVGDVASPGGLRRERGFVRCGRVAWPVRVSRSGEVAIDGPAMVGEELMSGSDELIGEMSVIVACRLGRIEATLAELASLAPGAVIGLGTPVGGDVDLCVGERVVARGELVEVDGQLGVKVTSVYR